MFKQPIKPLKALGINIYGGGFTLGVLKYFQVLGQWEEIGLGKRTFDLNFGSLHRPLKFEEWGTKESVGKAHLVYANPPCAPWSQANNHAKKTKESRFLDERLLLTKHTMETAVQLKPEVFISESVEAAYNVGKSHYDQYVQLWMGAGYSVTFFLTDAILHGAPCQRRRFHFIAHRSKLQLGSTPKISTPATVFDAIGDLTGQPTNGSSKIVSQHVCPSLNEHFARLMPHVPPGGKLQALINGLPGYSGPRAGFLCRRLTWDLVAPTMVRFSFIHPDGQRWISFREAMRLCTYPDSFKAHSAVEAVDAVLPAVARFLAKTAKTTIEKSEPAAVSHQVVDWRPAAKEFHGARVRGKPLDYKPAWKQLAKFYPA